jgi:putative NADPH-quinone reductase
VTKRIFILDGHPDPADERFVHALANSYCEGAKEGKHEVLTMRAANLTFPMLRSQYDYEHEQPVDVVQMCQSALNWATHVVILYPLWLGTMPAFLKSLLEQTFRPGFAFSNESSGRWPVKLLSGKSARIFVTMGMPAPLYRWFFRAHGVAALRRSILRFAGFGVIRTTFIGSVGNLDRKRAERWLARAREYGRRAK